MWQHNSSLGRERGTMSVLASLHWLPLTFHIKFKFQSVLFVLELLLPFVFSSVMSKNKV